MRTLSLPSTLRHPLRTAAMAMLLAATTACSGTDSDDAPRAVTLYDIVELTAADATSATFTLWRPDATTPVTLTAHNPSTDLSAIQAGNCVFLGYTPLNGEAHTSSDIEITALGTVNNSTLKKASPEKIEGWDTDPVYLMSLWRAGDKICMRVRLTYDTDPRLFMLVADETTATDPYPTAYLYHSRRDSRPNFSRQYYAAFDVTNLWNTPDCQGLRIRVCNSNIPTLTEFLVENPRPRQ